MVLKAKSDTPIKLIKQVGSVAAWQLPELDGGSAPAFRQPNEEKNETVEIVEEESRQVDEAELQAIRDAAYQEGLELGKAAGLDAAKKQIDEQNKLVATMIDQMIEPLSQCGEKTQQELVKLAFAIARQIVRRELQQDPGQLIAIIREALKLLPIGAENITIALHPEDANVVKSALSIDGEDESGHWQIKTDPSVERGSCQVDTETSKIDASIDKQIAVLFSRIAGGQRAGEATDE